MMINGQYENSNTPMTLQSVLCKLFIVLVKFFVFLVFFSSWAQEFLQKASLQRLTASTCLKCVKSPKKSLLQFLNCPTQQRRRYKKKLPLVLQFKVISYRSGPIIICQAFTLNPHFCSSFLSFFFYSQAQNSNNGSKIPSFNTPQSFSTIQSFTARRPILASGGHHC